MAQLTYLDLIKVGTSDFSNVEVLKTSIAGCIIGGVPVERTAPDLVILRNNHRTKIFEPTEVIRNPFFTHKTCGYGLPWEEMKEANTRFFLTS